MGGAQVKPMTIHKLLSDLVSKVKIRGFKKRPTAAETEIASKTGVFFKETGFSVVIYPLKPSTIQVTDCKRVING